MYCYHCGKQVPEISIYCMFCGVKFKIEDKPYPETAEEKSYEVLMQKYIVPLMKTPSVATYPRYEESMKKKVESMFSDYTVIETWVDSQNSFGTMIRGGVRIKLNKDGTPTDVSFEHDGSWSRYHALVL